MAYEKLMGRPHPSLKQHHLRKIDEEQVREHPRKRLKSPTPFVEMRSSKEGSVQSGSLTPKGILSLFVFHLNRVKGNHFNNFEFLNMFSFKLDAIM